MELCIVRQKMHFVADGNFYGAGRARFEPFQHSECRREKLKASKIVISPHKCKSNAQLFMFADIRSIFAILSRQHASTSI